MAAPKHAPARVLEPVRAYSSPEFVPANWTPDRPGDIEGLQPEGERLGYQGPDQGFALTIANRLRDRLQLAPSIAAGVSAEDAVRGAVNIALKRASVFGRAPVVHDLTIAFTIWGLFDANPPTDLVARRAELFTGVGNVHHYAEGRLIADLVPESTLRMTPAQVEAAYPASWRELTGA